MTTARSKRSLQFKRDDTWQNLHISPRAIIDVVLEGEIRRLSEAKLRIRDAEGNLRNVTVILRIDTPIEVEYYRHGGILPYVLRQLPAA